MGDGKDSGKVLDISGDTDSRFNALDLAREIARAWRLSLKQAFPHKEFDVQATETEDSP
ncbi:hypothetical protein P8A18_27645 [Streptomyces castrisilvae]|uniref:Uncharacterized protein n=1 Tax=Streptomyces castrisilvae TaxID=3033811 RepID=A0ABY9HSH0_9ACTN|nr:hypothetical protein [Streptomyces sp. Mut1]WLQ36972.1 hypothetical protein P8A18_27645 [Streptomyces sp. Mut1]